ncbi:DUF4145 domain-containing protein [Treponema zuelzerae]|uniref:DUF4145 domain-containing protein n=1 Tax=Teretinema zuelzerae TaxID=156 RepID=A0AAE3ELJ5_9SPIR|nr:DUF4145 domain-containing protein [Teretinema zuelzerae]MCD1656091.1 DUF4145 domain-containing protein [Teretinema zuelzerae]
MNTIDLASILKIDTPSIPWQCPHCDHHATLKPQDYSIANNYSKNQSAPNDSKEYINVQTKLIFCPNGECQKYTIYVSIYKAHTEYTQHSGTKIINDEYISGNIFYPNVKLKAYPDYIPQAIISDYKESYQIVELSPKASATISRRCLQGIIRDFWKVKPGKLVNEIDQIKEKVDELTFNAIDSVRKIGNIGAHMETDINYIIDVDKNEASILLSLIEMLLENWYIAKHDREERLRKIKSIADIKK